MTCFIYFFEQLAIKTPQLRNDENKMTMTVASFKKQLEKAYWQGHANGSEKAAKEAKVDDFLGSLFGKKP